MSRKPFANAVSEEEAKELYDTFACLGRANPSSKRRLPT
jgi:hypothetical protein